MVRKDKTKYPIGTKIKWVGPYRQFSIMNDDIGKTGEIVGIENNYPLIYLPDSKVVSCYSTTDRLVTIQCAWLNIESIEPKIGEQLEFSFMSE